VTVSYSAWQQHRACDRKRRYDTWLDARTAVLQVWQRGEWAYYYSCDWCSGWHLTSERRAA
jgi:hypothetical protein